MSTTAIDQAGRSVRTTGRGGRSGRGEHGVVAVEFALVMPILLLLVFGVVEFGFMLNRDMVIGNASRDGARVASLNGSYTEITDSITGELAQSGIPATGDTTIDICVKPVGATTCANMSATDYDAAAVSGATTLVRVSHEHSFLTPFITSVLGDSMSLEQTTQMRVE
jgi:Flp pilus assembly protein TadG